MYGGALDSPVYMNYLGLMMIEYCDGGTLDSPVYVNSLV